MPKKFTFEDVSKVFKDQGVELLSSSYVNINTPLKFICPFCGDIGYMSFNEIKRVKNNIISCKACHRKRFKAGQGRHLVKYSFEDVKKDFESNNIVLVSTEYKNTKIPLEFICTTPGCNNHGFISYMEYLGLKHKKLLCDDCKNNNRITIQKIEKVFNEKGAKLLTKEYKKGTQPLEFVCSNPGCNNIHHISWINFNYNGRNPKLLCKSCLGLRDNDSFILEIKKEFESKGSTLITTEYKNNRQPLEFTCSKCGKHHFISYHAYQAGTNKNLLCPKCSWNSHPDIDEIKDIFAGKGAKLLTTTYKNAHSKLKFECSNCGEEWEITWDSYNRGTNPDLLCQNCYKGRMVQQSGEYFDSTSVYGRRDIVNKYWILFYVPEFFNVVKDKDQYNMHHIILYSQDEAYRNSITNGYPLLSTEHIQNTRFYHKTPEGRCIDNWPDIAKLPYHTYDGFHFLDFNSVFIADVVYQKTSMTQNELYKKKKEFADKGIFYMPIFLTELLTQQKRDLVYSMIRNRLSKWFPDVYAYTGTINKKYYARKLEIKEVTSVDARYFFEMSHIQGFVGSKVFIGLYDGDLLVSCMAFSAPRSVGVGEYPKWELTRFATLPNTQVIGGASRLFKYFVNNYKPKSIVSFCDLRFSSLNPEETVYSKLGFNFEGRLRPNYRYRDPVFFQTYSRQAFQKSKLESKLPEYNKDLSESELMTLNGYVKQYDCGNFKFVWENTNI